MTQYESNALNQYTAVGDFIPEFDSAGNQTLVKTSTGIWQVTYNAENRPIRFESEDGSTVVQCGYDYMGRRSYKKVTTNGKITLHQRYIYRGYLQIACCDLTRVNTPIMWYILWDPTQSVTTRPLAIQKDGTWYTYGWDLTKNIYEVYGQSGYIRTLYTYSPYGAVSAEGDVTQPIQWSSEFNDTELGLVYYNYRYFAPSAGNWLTRDIVYVCNNVYSYLCNKVYKIDVKGLSPDTPSQNQNNKGSLIDEVKSLAQSAGISWILKAAGEIGVKEEKNKCCKRISEYADSIPNAWARNYMKEGNRAWCACFAYWCISDIGGSKPSKGNEIKAKAYETCWEASGMLFGALAVTSNKGNNHVTFVVGVSSDQKEIYCLGGNQSDQVKISRYNTSTVTAYRFPISAGYQQLPPIIVKGTNNVSSNDSTR